MSIQSGHALSALLAVLLATSGPPSRPTTFLTVHNRTNKTLSVSPPGSPWHPEPCDPPAPAAPRRWLGPGQTASYRRQAPGKEVASDVVIRSLHQGERVECGGLVIRAPDPDLDPPCGQPPVWPQEADPRDKFIGDEPPPDPEESEPDPEPSAWLWFW